MRCATPPMYLALSLLVIVFLGAGVPLSSAQSPFEKPNDTEAVIQPLLEVLKNDDARAVLIEALEGSAPSATASDAETRPSIAARLALFVQNGAAQSVDIGKRLTTDLSGISILFQDGRGTQLSALYPVFGTILVTFLVFFIGTRIGSAILGRSEPDGRKPDIMSAVIFGLAFVVVQSIVTAASYFAGGIASATIFAAKAGSFYQTLFLNAFLVFGVTRIVLRLLTGVLDEQLGLLHLKFAMRSFLKSRLTALAAILIFGIAFLVPTLNTAVSFTLGRSVRVLVLLAAALLSIFIVRSVSRMQAEQDRQRVEGEVVAKTLKSLLAQIWPVIAYLYIAVVFVVGVARPYLLADFVGGATLRTVAALIAGAIMLRLLRRFASWQFVAPEFLPVDSQALSRRLTSLFPVAARMLGAIAVLCVALVALDAWSVWDVSGWLGSAVGAAVFSGWFTGLLVLIVCALIWALATSWIDFRMSRTYGSDASKARTTTLLSLAKNVLTISLIVFGGMIALSELGVDIGPLIAGAGVLGLAIGFGAQKLVQDIISGIFIQLENAMNVGDVVQVGGVAGVVERLSLRSVALRDVQGIYHIIPFSSVDAVANYMRVFSYHVEEVGIAYKENVQDGKDAMQEAFDRLLATDHKSDILEPLEMHGVTALGDSAVNIRVRIKTVPGKQFALGRAYTELVKQVMDERGIEIPFPHTTLFLGRDKEGSVDTIRVEAVGKTNDEAS